ncbi:MAG: hypothetical protein WBG57_10105 [Ornithinimicrobium sp.]
MASDQSSTQESGAEREDADQEEDTPTVDDLTMGTHERKAHDPGDLAAPQQVAEAQDFMAQHSGVHGVGIGLGADGGPCTVIFADDLPADQVPETLDGLPVRVEPSGEFSASDFNAS